MQKRSWLTSAVALLTVAALVAPAFAQAPRVKTIINIENREDGGYWIGVRLLPIDDLAKSQLKLEHGLAVARVIDDGPAAKAGLQENDILLLFDGQPVTDIKALTQQVAKVQGKEIEVTVLRQGERQTIKLAPVERPQQLTLEANDLTVELPQALEELRKRLPALQEGGNDDVLLLRPGVLLPEGAGELELAPLLMKDSSFPAGTKITISKEGDGPATITVEHDGKTQIVDEKTIDELPAEVRIVVERALGRMTLSNLQLNVQPLKLWVEKQRQAAEDAAGPVKQRLEERRQQLMKKKEELERQAVEALEKSEAPEHLSAALKRVEEAVQSLQESDVLERIEREIKELRRDVEALKAGAGEEKKNDDQTEN